MSAVRSMTGFAVAEGTLADGTTFVLTLKSVNHRFLDVQMRLPNGWDVLEAELRRVVSGSVERGHVDVTLEIAKGSTVRTAVPVIQEQVLEALVMRLRDISARMGLTQEPDLSALLRVPGVVVTEMRQSGVPDANAVAAVLAAAQSAVATLRTVREQEGAALAVVLRDGMTRLLMASDEVSRLRAGVRQALYLRMRKKLEELLGSSSVNEDRLLTEAGLLAEKSDVEEELVRLRTHAERFSGILGQGGAVGKQLDFLLQELSREANTTLSKTGSAAGTDGLRMTELGLAMKAEIERAREQVQNLE